MTAIRSVVLGCGSYLPQKVLTNAELAARIDTSDEWIVQRTGIRQRHIAAENEFTSHLALHAARAALADAGIDAQSIDLIVLGTSTPDNTFPATAVAVKMKSAITTKRAVTATTPAWPVRCAISMKKAMPIPVPSSTDAPSTWMNFRRKMASISGRPKFRE